VRLILFKEISTFISYYFELHLRTRINRVPRHDDCRTCAASRRKHPPSKSYLIWQMCGDKEFMSFISGKIEWESPPSILVTRNPNWSQRSGTETGCVKGRY